MVCITHLTLNYIQLLIFFCLSVHMWLFVPPQIDDKLIKNKDYAL